MFPPSYKTVSIIVFLKTYKLFMSFGGIISEKSR